MKCRHGERTWSGSEPECAFDEKGFFVEDNWNCLLITKLRQLCGSYASDENHQGDYFWDEDDSTGTFFVRDIDFDEPKENLGRSYLHGALVILKWYKSHGQTDAFKIVMGLGRDSPYIINGTERDALEIVKLYEKHGWDFVNGGWKKDE